jgi:hypothetical protein
MKGINNVVWSRDRIIAYKKFLQGNQSVEYRGKKANGESYKRAVLVSKLISRNSGYKYSVSGGKLMVDDGERKREVLSADAVEAMVKRLYKNKAIALGKAPSVYNWMKIRYVGFGYPRIEKILKSIPEYQKYQARHLQKKKSRTVVVSHKPGSEIDADLMFFSKKYYKPGMNDNNQGMLVVVDRFSGYIAVRPIQFGENGKSAEVVARKMESIIRQDGFPRTRAPTIFTDNGVEFQSDYTERMRQLGYNHVIISVAAGSPSPHAERAVGIIRKLINQKLSANAKPKKGTQRWWPMARDIVRSYNDTPMTDSRGPETPNQLKGLRGQAAKRIVGRMQGAGAKRLGMKGNSRKNTKGQKVQKTLKILEVGDRVRVALEKLRKTGAMKRPFPKQRWSSKVHVIAKVHARKIGFARYSVRALPKQRWEREDLQLVGKQKDLASGKVTQPEDSNDTADAESKQGAKRAVRLVPVA